MNSLDEEIKLRARCYSLCAELNEQLKALSDTINAFRNVGCSPALVASAIGCLVGVQTTMAFAAPPAMMLIPVHDEPTPWRTTFNAEKASEREDSINSAVESPPLKGEN